MASSVAPAPATPKPMLKLKAAADAIICSELRRGMTVPGCGGYFFTGGLKYFRSGAGWPARVGDR